MIVDVPSQVDFEASGIELLNVAWGLVMELYYHLDIADLDQWDDGSTQEEFWTAAQRTLSTAAVLAHQASDTFLQARIAETSPFLLISSSVRDWPGAGEDGNVSFSAFRTHDSQDLPRAHDVIHRVALSPEYRTFLGDLREKRNRAVHTVDSALRVQPADIFRYVLEIAGAMVDRPWRQLREEYLYQYPLSVVHSPDHVEWQLPFEISTAVSQLTPSEARRFFNINKKQRRYVCLKCSAHIEQPWRTAMLEPNSPSSKTVTCFGCLSSYTVLRNDCAESDCPGNVIDAEEAVCLTCVSKQP